MKSITNKLVVMAAAMVAIAGAASAQAMKAEVPFSFKVSGTVMPAGTYLVTGTRSSGTAIFRMLNTDVSRSVMVVPGVQRYLPNVYADAKLVFRCSEGNCELAQIWSGGAVGAYDLHTSKPNREEAVLITIPATKAD